MGRALKFFGNKSFCGLGGNITYPEVIKNKAFHLPWEINKYGEAKIPAAPPRLDV